MAGETIVGPTLLTLYLGKDTNVPVYAVKNGTSGPVPYYPGTIASAVRIPFLAPTYYGPPSSPPSSGRTPPDGSQSPCVDVVSNYADFASDGYAQVNMIA